MAKKYSGEVQYPGFFEITFYKAPLFNLSFKAEIPLTLACFRAKLGLYFLLRLRAAPTRNAVHLFIQTAPIVATLLAVGKAVGFGHAPLHQREVDFWPLIAFAGESVSLISRDADIFQHCVCLSQML